MSDLDETADAEPRRLGRAVARGFVGRCPSCGEGRLFAGYLKPLEACACCGEPLDAYRTADLAPYLVTFAIGLVFTPLTLVLTTTTSAGGWLAPVLAVAALSCAALLLPRVKGGAVGLLWAMGGPGDD